MKNGKIQYETRESVLELLSDDEVATVSTAETAGRLLEDDEYLDLDRLDQGVQRAIGTAPKMGSVLPKKAIRLETWSKILARLDGHGIGKTDASA